MMMMIMMMLTFMGLCTMSSHILIHPTTMTQVQLSPFTGK